MPASSHGLPTSGMRLIGLPQPRAGDLDRVDPRPVRRMALELVPALRRRARCSSSAPPMTSNALARRRSTRSAAPGPSSASSRSSSRACCAASPARAPARTRGSSGSGWSTSIIISRSSSMRDEPLVHQPEDELACCSASSAGSGGGTARAEQHALLRADSSAIGAATSLTGTPRQPVEAVDVDAVFVQRRNRRQAELLAQRESLLRRSPARCGRCPCLPRWLTSSHGMTRCSTPLRGRAARRTGRSIAGPAEHRPRRAACSTTFASRLRRAAS